MKKHKRIRQKAPQPVRTIDAKTVGKLIAFMNARNLQARYDSLKPEYERPRPQVRTDFTETEQVFNVLGGRTRPVMYAEADQLYDNSPVGAQVDDIVRLSIGSNGGEPIFIGDNAEFQQKFFDDWKKNCGWYSDETFNEMLCMILRAVLVHGDCLVVIDDVLTEGKLAVYDADQVTNIGNFEDWRIANGLPEGTRQVEGVVLSPVGRVLGYFLSAMRNMSYVCPENATFIPASIGHLVFLKKKITQYRGESSLVPNFDLSQDTDDLLKAEVRAAQLTAEHALVIEEPEGFGNSQLAGVLEGFTDEEQSDLTNSVGLSNEDIQMLESVAKEGENFKDYSGKSAIAYTPSGTKVTNLNNSQRPSTQILDWTNRLADTTGKRLGMMSSLSRGRAENSYSSGRIEIELSWMAFREYQQLLEKQVVDYVVSYLLPHSEYICEWTKAFEVDEEKSIKCTNLQLQNGTLSYQQLLGPRWQEKLKQVAIEKKYLEELDLTNLTVFQTTSGAVIEEATPQPPTEMPVEKKLDNDELEGDENEES